MKEVKLKGRRFNQIVNNKGYLLHNAVPTMSVLIMSVLIMSVLIMSVLIMSVLMMSVLTMQPLQ
jgi:hypothetical protein